MKGTAALTAPITENTIKQVKHDRDERIQYHRKRNAKMMLEDVWKQFAFKRVQEGEDEAFRYILQNKIITGIIHRISKSFYSPWKKNTRLSLHDFESVAYEKAWKIIANYSPHYQEWFLYERLNNGI